MCRGGFDCVTGLRGRAREGVGVWGLSDTAGVIGDMLCAVVRYSEFSSTYVNPCNRIEC